MWGPSTGLTRPWTSFHPASPVSSMPCTQPSAQQLLNHRAKNHPCLKQSRRLHRKAGIYSGSEGCLEVHQGKANARQQKLVLWNPAGFECHTEPVRPGAAESEFLITARGESQGLFTQQSFEGLLCARYSGWGGQQDEWLLGPAACAPVPLWDRQ